MGWSGGQGKSLHSAHSQPLYHPVPAVSCSIVELVSVLGIPAFFDHFSVLLTEIRKDSGFGIEKRPSLLLMVPFPGRMSPVIALIWRAQMVACVMMMCLPFPASPWLISSLLLFICLGGYPSPCYQPDRRIQWRTRSQSDVQSAGHQCKKTRLPPPPFVFILSLSISSKP